MARHDLRDALHQQVTKSIALGARPLLGGKVPEGAAAWYAPTVLTDVRKGMPAYDEELFGPVAAVIGVRDETEAIRTANDSVFGLGAGVLTGDPKRGERVAQELESGSVFVNDNVRSDPRLPFGGVKESGYGRELVAFRDTGIREREECCGRVKLPIRFPYPLMEAETVKQLPRGDQWQYEPKWDGFRCLAFRDGDEVRLQSKAGKPLERYFPEVVQKFLALGARRFVLDSEIVVKVDGRLSFDALLLRIHPAQSRIERLAQEQPAQVKVFDLLVDERGALRAGETLTMRRRWLETFAKRYFKQRGISLSDATTQYATATRWLAGAGRDTDGVVAKRRDLPYQSGNRDGMVKVKRIRSADCVVGGFRYASKGKQVGSLLLGLYDSKGLLHHVGFCSGLDATIRKGLLARLEKLVKPPGFTGRAPARPSRWNESRSPEWEPLAPKLVVEVAYDHVSGGRFRHGTRFLRWRPDKAAKQCTLRQIGVGSVT